jgi:hypothetical protein
VTIILKKLGCGIAMLSLLLVVLSGCDTSASEGSGGDDASTSGSTGWASSADIFKQRWNSEVQAAYRINEFRVDHTGKNGGNLLGATVYAGDSDFMLTTHSQSTFEAMCTQTVEAALGIPHSDAVAVVTQAASDLQTSPMAYGQVQYQGYNVSMQVFASSGELDCNVMPKSN